MPTAALTVVNGFGMIYEQICYKWSTKFLHTKPWSKYLIHVPNITRPEGLLDPKIRDAMSDFLEIFPTENKI